MICSDIDIDTDVDAVIAGLEGADNVVIAAEANVPARRRSV
jgi:hypothetical protein